MRIRQLLFHPAIWLAFMSFATAAAGGQGEMLPFDPKFEVYRDKDGGLVAFKLRLEQPFLAEEFEKGNYLRLRPLDKNA